MHTLWFRKPELIGLAPMDGVSDAAFRYITDTYGHPDVLFTEFTAAEGLRKGIPALLTSFVKHATPTPTIGQIFGSDPDAFYTAALVVCALGFDGVDINMGCPDKHVAKKGGGAGLICDPPRAQQIIKAVRRATVDWANGISLSGAGVPDEYNDRIRMMNSEYGVGVRRSIPVSVKTRIGFDRIVTTEWITLLLEAGPDAITLHGRTLRQLYTGLANWEEIARAAERAHTAGVPLFGNGDVQSVSDARQRISTYHVDGVLIGRASFGNPWLFSGTVPRQTDRIEVAKEHAHVFTKLTPTVPFISLRKHLAWYARAFPHATDVRNELVRVQTLEELDQICQRWYAALL